MARSRAYAPLHAEAVRGGWWHQAPDGLRRDRRAIVLRVVGLEPHRSAPEMYASLAAASRVISKAGEFHMAFVAYYDGSGKSDQPSTTLTGIAAPESLWQKFEPLWLDALDRNEVPDRDFHMTDLMSSQRKFQGWDARMRRNLLTDLFNVFGQFRVLDFSAYSCTVFSDAYTNAKSKLPCLRKPEAICVDYCVGGAPIDTRTIIV
jgi:hypothetical protein